MATFAKPLLQLTASDLMARDVVLIAKEVSLRAAARLLSRSRISGAPVVDGEGRCIGVVSATDFVRWAEKDTDAATAAPADTDCHCAWQVVEPEELPADQVDRYMSRDPVMVLPDAPIGELARLMLDAHIHRVIVRDVRNRPVGIVSSTDILAAVARAPVAPGAHTPGARNVSYRADMASFCPMDASQLGPARLRPQDR